MPTTFADLLHSARQRLFVGRRAEIDLFESVLSDEGQSFSVMHIHGPGGVGKTTLLHTFADLARRRGWTPVYVDTRSLESSPDALIRAVGAGLGVPTGGDPVDHLVRAGGRHVLLFDTTETVAALDWWLRERFLPALPERTLVVLAGRSRPSTAWRIDPGWQALLRVVPLRNLNAADSAAYLQKRQVPEERHREIVAFTRGYPLALSLVSDVVARRAVAIDAASPDIVQTLLTHLLDETPSAEHRMALHVCAALRHTTEQTLALILEREDVHEPFEWLRSLSFIDAGPAGLFPHDLARTVLSADLHWRHPEWRAELHSRARLHYTKLLRTADGHAMREVLIDFLYLHRENPLLKPFFTRLHAGWHELASPIIDDALAPSDHDALASMVERHEGESAAGLARYWLGRQPAGVRVYRDDKGTPRGFLLPLVLTPDLPAEAREDPAVAASLDYLDRFAPLRPGEHALLYRFWMANEGYQQLSMIQGLCFIQMVRLYLTSPGLAFSFLPCADPDFWQFLFAYVDLHRIPPADYTVDGRTWGSYGHDWRVTPPSEWLSRLAERVPSPDFAASTPAAVPSVFVLSQEDFAAAVREALRELRRPARLQDNPLLRSRLIVDASPPEADAADRAEVLRLMLRDTVQTLDTSPRDRKLFRALEKTYLKPAPSQEVAAEQLGIPYSTFRRHLMAGVDFVADALWQREVAPAD